MKRLLSAVFGLILASAGANAQSSTISARPGAVNYLEGKVQLNGDLLNSSTNQRIFLGQNDVLATDGSSKAEVLLTPGVFLRLGADSEIRMVSPSLVHTQVQLNSGEAMIEATGLVPDNHIEIIDRGSITTLTKTGLYRFSADNPPVVEVLGGRAGVQFDDRNFDLKEGRKLVLAANSKPEKFDRKATDDLFAWSNVRSEYEAAATYRLASLNTGGFHNGFAGGGFNPGWYWDNGFSSWAWLPGSAFYSPFGYGFYGPAQAAYFGGYGIGYSPWLYGVPTYRHWHHQPYTGGIPVRAGNGVAVAGAPGLVHPVPPNGIVAPISPSRLPAAAFRPAAPSSAWHPGFQNGPAARAVSPSFGAAPHSSMSSPHSSISSGGGAHSSHR